MGNAPYSQYQEDQLILRDHLAVDRTVLANERTFLAYLRTSLTFLLVGLSFLKFFDSLVTRYCGIAFLVFSGFMLAVGVLRFRKMNTTIHAPIRGGESPSPAPPLRDSK